MITLGMKGRKWEIFSSAMDLFDQNGFESTTMNDIAAANDITAASIYNYFTSKDALLGLMFQFYHANLLQSGPVLEKILDVIDEKSPKELLFLSMSYYSEELQPYMDKIFSIALMQANKDKTAYDVVWKYHFDQVRTYLNILLQTLIQMKRIEPLDIDSFIEIFNSFAFCAVLKNRSIGPVGMEKWLNGLDMIFSFIKELPADTSQGCDIVRV